MVKGLNQLEEAKSVNLDKTTSYLPCQSFPHLVESGGPLLQILILDLQQQSGAEITTDIFNILQLFRRTSCEPNGTIETANSKNMHTKPTREPGWLQLCVCARVTHFLF